MWYCNCIYLRLLSLSTVLCIGIEVVMGFRSHYPEICHLGFLTILSWSSLSKWQKQGGYSDLLLPLFPETLHNTLMQEVPSLYLEARSVLISENKGTPTRILTNRACSTSLSLLQCTSYSWISHILPWLSPLHQTCRKIFRSVSSGLHFIMAPVSYKTSTKYIFVSLLLTCLCRFNFRV